MAPIDDAEEWRPVVGWEDRYAVSNFGRVQSLPHVRRNGNGLARHPARVLKARVSGRGKYLEVRLEVGGRNQMRSPHRLVLESFVGPGDGLQAMHLNGDKFDNRLANLAWGTAAENMRELKESGRPCGRPPSKGITPMTNAPGGVWDQFESGGNYVSFENIGDEFAGTILNIGAKTWPPENGKPARTTPQLQMRDDSGEEWTLTAGWALLIAALKKEAPNVGDHLRIRMTGVGPKPKETREWAVTVTRGNGVAAPAPTAASPSPAPAPAADPMAGITPEQLAAMQAAMAPAAAWDSDPRVPALRAMGIADEAIRSTLKI